MGNTGLDSLGDDGVLLLPCVVSDGYLLSWTDIIHLMCIESDLQTSN